MESRGARSRSGPASDSIRLRRTSQAVRARGTTSFPPHQPVGREHERGEDRERYDLIDIGIGNPIPKEPSPGHRDEGKEVDERRDEALGHRLEAEREEVHIDPLALGWRW